MQISIKLDNKKRYSFVFLFIFPHCNGCATITKNITQKPVVLPPPPLNKFLLDTKEYARIRHLTQSYIKDSQMHITQEQIANVKASLRTRMAMIDFDILGRTLAYSPYMPRANKEFFIRNERQNTPKLAHTFHIESTTDTSSLLYQTTQMEEETHFDAYVLNLCPQYTQESAKDPMQHLESISLLRRHSTLPIIHIDIFIDKYQILESALFGADTLLIPAAPLEGKALKELLNFARRLEFDVFVGADNKDELKKAIFSGADMLFLPQESFKELLSLVPNTQVIATNHPNEYGVDIWLRG